MAYLGKGGRHYPRFELETSLFYREARLFALAFPEEAEKAATLVAQDPTAHCFERTFAIAILFFVAQTGSRSAKDAMYALTTDRDARISDVALSGVGDTDTEGAHRSLYWSKSKEGSETAFEIASRWLDQGTIAHMKEFLSIPKDALYPQGQWRASAERVLKRLDILASPTWQTDLESILSTTEGESYSGFVWAIQVAKHKDPNWLKPILQNRIRAGIGEAKSTLARLPKESRKAFEEQFISSPQFGNLTRDPYYDDVLVAYSEIGGTLDDLVRGRLQTFGYACDPKERLTELLSENR
jgi:hypothetical protein